VVFNVDAACGRWTGNAVAAGGSPACAKRILPLSVDMMSFDMTSARAPDANRMSVAVIRQRGAEPIMRVSRGLMKRVEFEIDG
jgi:hypothetical protein